MIDAIHEFSFAMQGAGLVPGEVIPDGKIHRCSTEDKLKSRNGWYVFFSEPPASGAFGNWRSDKRFTWASRNGDGSTPSERALFKQRLELTRREREEELRRQHDQAAAKAKRIVSSLPAATDDNPYLKRKGVRAGAGLRAQGDTLIVPVMDETGAIISFQAIKRDGEKRFLAGGKTKGGFFSIKGGETLFICEGYATGATIYEATGGTVLCALSAGNLESVACMARERYPMRSIVLCADDDRRTKAETGKNPGREAALQAARAIGAKVCFPAFKGDQGTDLNDMAAEQGIESVKSCLEVAQDMEPTMQVAEWPEPVAFSDTETPPITSDMVPDPLRRFCEAVSSSVQVPFELPVMGCLGALAASAQGRFKVQVRTGYEETLCIYTLTPLPPGERKSAALEAARRPLVSWEREKAHEMAPEIRQARSEYQTKAKAIEKLRARAGNGKTDINEIIRQVQSMEEALPEVPVAPRILCDDVTPEALAAHMGKHADAAAVIEAEGGLFEILAGLYTNGRSNLNLVLKSWSGERTVIDRKGRDSIHLNDPALTLCLSPQPAVLRDIAEMKGFRGRGFLGRILYCLPKSKLGGRTVETKPIPAGIEAEYHSMLFRILDTPSARDEHGERTAYSLRLSDGAYRQWAEFAQAVEVELRDGGQFEALRDWAGKLPGQAVRIAGLYHVAAEKDPAHVPISEDTMRQALDLAAVLADHARAAFTFMGTDPGIECGRKILRWISEDNIFRFTARDAFERVKGVFQKMEQVWIGLRVLEDRFYIRPAEVESRTGPGRKPSPVYEVNPYSHNSHNSHNRADE